MTNTGITEEFDGTLMVLPYYTITGTPGMWKVNGPGTQGNPLMRRHAARLRAAAKRQGRRVHINTTPLGGLLVTVR